jgi:hypothetical protein
MNKQNHITHKDLEPISKLYEFLGAGLGFFEQLPRILVSDTAKRCLHVVRGSGRDRGATGRLNEHNFDNAGLKAAWKLKIIQSQGSRL